MDAETADFARFYAESRDDCLRTVLAGVADLDRAKDMVDEAFARAWAAWRKVRRHPAPRAAAAVGLTHQPGTGAAAPSTRLAAWTVSEKRPGLVVVKVFQLKDPAGLQRELRGDGVPAFVRFNNENPPECLYYPMSLPTQFEKLSRRIFPQPSNAQVFDNVALIINTAAIPHGVGLWIEFSPPQKASWGIGFTTGYTFVYASGHCGQKG
jgi:hypothetical protein